MSSAFDGEIESRWPCSFFFRGLHGELSVRAHNPSLFLEIGEGVDPNTYLRNGDFEAWLRTAIKDDDLADEVANVAANEGLELYEIRALVPHRCRATLHSTSHRQLSQSAG